MQGYSEWKGVSTLEGGATRESIKVLVVEDDEVDLIRIKRFLSTIFGDAADVEFTDTWERASAAISAEVFDIYIVDHFLGAKTGLELIERIVAREDSGICILLTGQESREIDLAASQAGVVDYLVKSELTLARLERCLRYALEAMRQRRLLVVRTGELEAAKQDVEAALARAEKSEAEYRWLALHDMLTKIPNRTLFSIRLRDGIEQAMRSEKHLALFLLDLDRFKTVNDTLGHPIGDVLLVEVAGRLSALMRQSDVIARLGGDEFAVIVSNLGAPGAAATAAEKIIKTLSEPYTISGHLVDIGVSIGIAIAGDGAKVTPEEMMMNADAALYRAKTSGRGVFQFFDDELNRAVQRTLLIKRELGPAIAAMDFSLYYQPKIGLQSGLVVGMEALVRWMHTELGPISPGEFIPATEATGQIIPLSDWILEEACRTIETWQNTPLGSIPVAINVSAQYLKQQHLQTAVLDALDRFSIDPAMLELEITETAALTNLDAAVEQLGVLRARGVKVAIDDFGTGYSSLALATRLPADCLKIDMSFVSGMLTNSANAAAVDTTITLAHSLGMKAVAEGVETWEQLVYLRDRGCDQAQGYLFAKPAPRADMLAWNTAREHMPAKQMRIA